jgi:hypothetical protein
MNDDDKMALWDRLFSTDPAQTKTFRRAGGFSGTAIKPYWMIMRATEEFGPAGKGWGWNELDKVIFEAVNNQAIWFSKVEVWYTLGGVVHRVGPQWGATELVSFRGENKTVFVDEEAAKKAITDGITKCLSYLGLAGDVHMGLFDDSKYVAERKIEERKAREADAQAERKVEAEPKPKLVRKAPEGAKPAKRQLENVEPAPPPEPAADDPQNVEDRSGGNGADPVPAATGAGHGGHQPSERAWLENVRAKIASITATDDLLSYWESQKPMATKVAEGAHAAFAKTAIELARNKMSELRKGGGK